ncbi:MAG TPA: hypothetical protein EYO31_00240 [Phycisphaerales bacterium]|nr:hypothetical protein [Phycisphaerales bacterium]
MSYHDGYYAYPRNGIAVVNPLIQNEKKIAKIQEILTNEFDENMTAKELRDHIKKVLEEHE